jgi:hypothetical protein
MPQPRVPQGHCAPEPAFRAASQSRVRGHGGSGEMPGGMFEAMSSAGELLPARSSYEPYWFTPSVAFGLGTAEPFGATRWVF